LVKYTNILVGIDGSEESFKATSAALSIAAKFGSEVTALYVIHNPYPDLFHYEEEKEDRKRLQKAKEDLNKWIGVILREEDSNKNANIKPEVIESTRPVYSEVLEYAESNKNDFIVIGSRGRTGFKKLLLGSVASDVVAYSHCPVPVVR
jgi:nucleotide-binding universal stress UspA family protein